MAEERDPQTFALIGAAMEIHKQLGHGFLEAVYQESATIEFPLRKIPFVREVLFDLHYKGTLLSSLYRADFVCFGNIIVEFKAQSHLTGSDDAQVLNYLKATGFHRGMLFNFGALSLQHKRLVFGYDNK